MLKKVESPWHGQWATFAPDDAGAAAEEPEVTSGMRHEWNKGMHEAAFELLNKYEMTAPLVPLYQTVSMALHGVLVTAKLCEPTCMTEMNGICEQWYDATVGPPCRPAGCRPGCRA